MDKHDVRLRANGAAMRHIRASNPAVEFFDETAGFLADWRANLIEGVSWEDVEPDLDRSGNGAADDGQRAAAKFKGTDSTCALVVNTFGQFRRAPSQLSIAGICEFVSVQFDFEAGDPICAGDSNCDVLALTSCSAVLVESTFLEPLTATPAEISPRYGAAFLGGTGPAPIAERAWSKMYRRLRDDPSTYRYLDAAQLVKHYLALIQNFPLLERTLFYLYWEPVNATDLQLYRDFRREITDFALSVADCDTRFVAKSYRAQLQEWQHNRARLDLGAQLERLRGRYEFSI